MILIIAVKHKYEEHLSVAASEKCFIISMTKVISFSTLMQQPTHLQVFFPWDMMYEIILPALPNFYQYKFLQNDQSTNKHSSEECPIFGL